jgi:hypothetical protein
LAGWRSPSPNKYSRSHGTLGEWAPPIIG